MNDSENLYPTKIESFSGNCRWLSNFAPVRVFLDGIEYQSVEHAYQAAKTLISSERESIRKLSAGQAKREGRKITMRPDWEAVKELVMLDLTRQKYQDPMYKKLLLSTNELEIEEGNVWGDTYWGVCRGIGANRLGKILMKVRQEIRDPTIITRKELFDAIEKYGNERSSGNEYNNEKSINYALEDVKIALANHEKEIEFFNTDK
jgi:ribA/ribD-fused uncharacterized protein